MPDLHQDPDRHAAHKPGQRIIGCDFDGTLATYHGWKGHDNLGEPVEEMVRKVKEALDQGDEVFIFSARVNPGEDTFKEGLHATESYLLIGEWCKKHIGQLLPITHEKSRRFTEIWDDRAKEVIPNTGVFLGELVEATAGQ